MYSVAGVLPKLVFALLFASLWGVSGALWGVLAGTMLGIVTLRLIAGMRLPSLRSSLTPLTASQGTYLGGTMTFLGVGVLVVAAGVLQNIDIVYAKALFPSG